MRELIKRSTPRDVERSAASRHRSSVNSALEPLGVFGTIETGSFTHGTAVRGHADVDVLVRMEGSRPSSSDVVLARVRDALKDKFKLTPIRVSRPAVVIDFAGGAERWEVIPGYYSHKTNDHGVWDIPAPGGNWIETSPSAHLSYVNGVNASPAGGAKSLARLIKTWKYSNSSLAKVSSFYLEMRAARYMRDEDAFVPFIDFKRLLRRLADSELSAMNDPTGTTSRFYAASTENYRATAVRAMSDDAARAEAAFSDELAGNRGRAFERMNVIFPGGFPDQFY